MEKLKRGFVREDGMVFWQYSIKSKTGEYWLTPERFEEYKIKCKGIRSKWFHKNIDKVGNRLKEWRLANPNKNKEAKENWIKKNPDKRKQIASEYQRKNPHVVSRNNANRRSNLDNSILMLHRDQENIMKTIYEKSLRISECTGIKHHVDHVIPISRGGYHIHTNLQVLPAKINMSKGAKLEFQIAA